MQFELAPNKTSCNIPPPLTHQRLKRTKINKTMLCAFPLHFFAQSSLYQNWKTNKYSIRTATELGPSVSESLARITKFYTLIDSEHKTHKTDIKNRIWTVARPGTSSTGTSLRIHPRQTVDWWTLTPQKVIRPDSHPTGE